ncbi:MAG: hypothetical protein PW789_09225 [Edaphobacter sp.]|uniref:hypothetical protein n=1 Tax=Edaphobacter sp. TaxID=1934404 RepID=UPI00239BE94E|nr:hypothetical protein [Edaphobacter sp.]MDE1176776.1 hypothetical protein [Edaphobacter sp.]
MATATLRLRVFDGSRQPFSDNVKMRFMVTDGTQKLRVDEITTANEKLYDNLPFYDSYGDNYTVLITAPGYKQSGYHPVKLSDSFTQTVDVMMVSNDPGFNFAGARWPSAKKTYPFLAADVDDATGKARYGDLVEAELPLACLLNIAEASSDVALAQGMPLDYIKEVRWDGDYAPKQDRFFCWCDAQLINQIKIGESAGQFMKVPVLLHPGATSSWKEVQFTQADLQFTFHENDTKTIGSTNCVMLELDIDYYSDPIAHIFVEVTVNGLAHTLTNPVEVYILRWMAGRMANKFEFAPLYTLTD